MGTAPGYGHRTPEQVGGTGGRTGGLDRRRFLDLTGRSALGIAILAACGDTNATGSGTGTATASPPVGSAPPVTATSPAAAAEQARAIVGDVVGFALTSEEWDGPFGWVTMRLRPGLVDGQAVYAIRTDASDADYARAESLVYVPKIGNLDTDTLAGEVFVFDDAIDDQPWVFSSEPGRDDYTPAWRLRRVTWSGDPKRVASVADIRDAQQAGALTVEDTGIVINAGMAKWSSGTMPIDAERTAYLGTGQLLEEPDTVKLEATLKLSQCYPNSRYFALDHSLEGVANETSTPWSPKLQSGPSQAGAVGVTNVFMNGLTGPGPMGAQPSVFDFEPGNPVWSPYWDHFMYAWKDGATPRLLTTQGEIHAARDAGELDEIPGAPPTNGTVFTVNCPAPVLAPTTYEASVAP